jgi:hypothetical protein
MRSLGLSSAQPPELSSNPVYLFRNANPNGNRSPTKQLAPTEHAPLPVKGHELHCPRIHFIPRGIQRYLLLPLAPMRDDDTHRQVWQSLAEYLVGRGFCLVGDGCDVTDDARPQGLW